MKKGIWAAALALCLALTGCAALLDRSYSVVEPYRNRYWDASGEDTLRAENYQDLVNSLLMLVQQGAEEGVIRYYAAQRSYAEAFEAGQEVRRETTLGAYLLESVTVSYESQEDSATITDRLVYREDVEDVAGLMALSDSQSLVDLLRLALREDHARLTAKFVYETELQSEVRSAVEGLWREICLEELAAQTAPSDGETEETPPAAGEEPAPETQPGGETEPPAEASVEIPPCPWQIRFYPDTEYAGIVEVLLKTA